MCVCVFIFEGCALGRGGGGGGGVVGKWKNTGLQFTRTFIFVKILNLTFIMPSSVLPRIAEVVSDYR